jgi:hypothetical protein
MSPFFLKQYVKSHAHDIFEAYPQQLTEMALRIPYLCRKANEESKDAASAELDKVKFVLFGKDYLNFYS